MKRNLILILFLAVQLVQGQTYNFTYDNVLRSYIVHLPTGYSASNKYPLVFNLHGYTSNASQQQTYSQMDLVADTAKFIAVYPDGMSNAWNAWTGPNSSAGVKDVGFLSALVDTMKKKFSVDSMRVFSCGMSNGGFMSYRLACELQQKFAAIASVTGLMADSVRIMCQNLCAVPVLDIHGTADGTVNYNGAGGYVSVDSTMAIWKGKNGCPAVPVVTNLANISTSDSCSVTKYYYGPCSGSSEVVLYKVINGGHTWPGAFHVPSLGNTNQDIKASGEIWNFFRKHSLKCQTISVPDDPLPSGIRIFPNPAGEQFTVSGLRSPARIAVYNLLGEVVFDSVINDNQSEIQLNAAPGVYFLRVDHEGTSSFHPVLKK